MMYKHTFINSVNDRRYTLTPIKKDISEVKFSEGEGVIGKLMVVTRHDEAGEEINEYTCYTEGKGYDDYDTLFQAYDRYFQKKAKEARDIEEKRKYLFEYRLISDIMYEHFKGIKDIENKERLTDWIYQQSRSISYYEMG